MISRASHVGDHTCYRFHLITIINHHHHHLHWYGFEYDNHYHSYHKSEHLLHEQISSPSLILIHVISHVPNLMVMMIMLMMITIIMSMVIMLMMAMTTIMTMMLMRMRMLT